MSLRARDSAGAIRAIAKSYWRFQNCQEVVLL